MADDGVLLRGGERAFEARLESAAMVSDGHAVLHFSPSGEYEVIRLARHRPRANAAAS
jgi:hypothetical protein